MTLNGRKTLLHKWCVYRSSSRKCERRQTHTISDKKCSSKTVPSDGVKFMWTFMEKIYNAVICISSNLGLILTVHKRCTVRMTSCFSKCVITVVNARISWLCRSVTLFAWPMYRWFGSVTVRTLDLTSRGPAGSTPDRVAIKWLLVPGWVTVCGQVNHLGV